MLASLAADLIVLVHLGFVVFVALGGLLVRRWRWLVWVHLPCALYGAAIEVFGWICPLTPLEQAAREAAGHEGYSGGFIEHHLEGVLYPQGWAQVHLWLAVAVVALNVAAYAWVFLWPRGRKTPRGGRDRR
jgi:hypothetical protein